MKGIFGSGTRDFLIIRISSLILLGYFLFIITFIIINSPLSFQLWSGWFENTFLKVFTSLFLFSFAVHTWIGTWAIGTDYLTANTLGSLGNPIYKIYRTLCVGIIVITLFWALRIIW